MKIDWEHFCGTFNLGEQDQLNLKTHWQELTENWQESSLPACLDVSMFKKLYPFCEGADSLAELLPLAEEIHDIAWHNPEVSLLAHISCHGAFVLKTPFYFLAMPEPIPLLGEKLSGMFSFLVSLGAYPHMVQAYAECGVPEQYATEALKWFGGTMFAYKAAHNNIPGRPFQFSWIRNYIDKNLFRIGRLEFKMHTCPDWLPLIYRNQSGALAVLARDGWQFKTAEYRAGQNEPCIFTSRLAEDEKTISGIPIPPDGLMDFSQWRVLSKSEWTPLLSPWDICPSIHIPGGSRMPWAEVKQSILAARDFFAKYFHRQIPLVCCCSWILNPAWETELKDSNMARFRQQGYAFPGTPWGDRAGQNFVFGRSDVPPDVLPATNSIQQAMQRCYKAGRCGSGALFILMDDVEKLDDCYYKKRFLQEL